MHPEVADTSQTPDDIPTLLDLLITERRYAVKSKSDLIKALEDSKVQKQAYIQLFFDSVKAGNITVAEWLFIPGILITSQDDDGWTALRLAALCGGERGMATLQAAAHGGHVQIVNRLLDEKAEVNPQPADYGGQTALQASSEGGYLDVMNRLLNAMVDINAHPTQSKGRTALQAAAQHRHLNTTRRLLDAGTDINDLSTRRSKHLTQSSSLRLAEVNGYVDVAQLLRARGAKEIEQLVQERAIDEEDREDGSDFGV
ncbi:ankyrin repeat-containing domain protein [Pyronema omphalodes]|nr:ankyrin repeat-containing domain protein [Pyronema omphalodes]